jgi:glycerophosphoryl diester phosphodiesterase
MAIEHVLPLDGEHLILLSEPGKHAFAPEKSWFFDRAPEIIAATTTRFAGVNGMWVTPLFEEEMASYRTPEANRLVLSHLQRLAFEPAWEFDRQFEISPNLLVPWHALQRWIPRRVVWWLQRLREDIPPAEMRFWRIAHRGASAHAPENTLAAFRQAARLDADMVELDVQMSADGVPVILHDATLDRFPGHAGEVRRKRLAELKSVDVGQGERIPTLVEAIQTCREELLGMYIELKTGDAVDAVDRAIREHHLYEWTLVGSFRPDWVAAIKRLDPRIQTSILFTAPGIDPVALARAVRADFVHPCWENAAPQPHALLTADWIQRVRDAGLGVILWHEERPEEISALRKMGVDGICSNAPELLK